MFEAFSRAPHYLGPFGNGSKMKYVANLMVAVHTVVAGEAFTLARKAGLDPAQMFAVVSDGAAGSRALDVRGEMLSQTAICRSAPCRSNSGARTCG